MSYFASEGMQGSHVVVLTYRVLPGKQADVLKLYEGVQSHLKSQIQGYITGELLSDPDDPRSYVEIERYDREEACHRAQGDREYLARYFRLLGLVEAIPKRSAYRTNLTNNTATCDTDAPTPRPDSRLA